MTDDQIQILNHQFADASVQDVLSFLIKTYANTLTFASSLGAEDQVLTDMVFKLTPSPDIFVLDTNRLHPETLETMRQTEKRYSFSYHVHVPDESDVSNMIEEYGENLFYDSVKLRKLCCGIRKVQPLRRALSGYSVWVTGIRNTQSSARQNVSLFEWDVLHQMMKVNPLLHWSSDDVWQYIKLHKVPYNPLHDKGYPSIGCEPCTRAIKPEEDERAGRWWWELNSSKECGLHER